MELEFKIPSDHFPNTLHCIVWQIICIYIGEDEQNVFAVDDSNSKDQFISLFICSIYSNLLVVHLFTLRYADFHPSPS